jgi:acyl-CoA synthetase (AMP-forming)/AMP-acid ligase II
MTLPACSVLGEVLRANAAALGGKPAFVCNERSLSFAEVNKRVNRLVDALSRLGLERGDRVALLARNRPEVFEIYGTAKSGLVAVPLNFRLSPRELAHPLADSRPRVLIAEPEFVPSIDSLRAQLAGVQHFIVFGEEHEGWLNYERLLARASDSEPRAEVRPQELACLIYSSGTTGVPKAAMLTHGALLNDCRAVIELLGLEQADVGLAVMPLFHVGGMWYHLFPSFASGCTTVMQSAFEPRAVLESIAAHRVTNVHLVPTMIAALLEDLQARDDDLGSLRTLYYAASPIPVATLTRALDVLAGCGFVQSFGSTEGGCITALTAADHVRALRDPAGQRLLLSCGRALAGAKVQIRDASGKPLPPGETGDIAVKSDRLMAGYWNNAAATAEALVGGWLYTGDVGCLDEEGYLTIVDRKHDMIVTGGENVYPREVEEVLYQDPDVAEAAVFAIPDPKWVERVAAAVVLKAGCAPSPEGIRERASRRLASYKCPKTVVFVASLPKNATGKVLKKELRRQYAGWLESQREGASPP